MSNFDNIGGIYAKDSALRQSVNNLRTTVTSKTIKPLTVTNDGTYIANPADGVYGYSPVTVSVNPPWEPLEDGYSNFWFELDNDTLSPWLNFSAKNNDAVIDWGDGSGEVALDTLTPTHTYSKAGKYVVKVKGVTEIAKMHSTPYQEDYFAVLKYVELNSEVTSLSNNAFMLNTKMRQLIGSGLTTIGNSAIYFCSSLEKLVADSVTSLGNLNARFCENLKELSLNSVASIGSNSIQYCVSMETLTLPSTLTSILSNTISSCLALKEIHVQATTPPTLGGNNFSDLSSDYVIYVPTGTLSAYQTAWGAYADHIVEEGQSLSKSQLRAIEEEQKKSDNGEEMR